MNLINIEYFEFLKLILKSVNVFTNGPVFLAVDFDLKHNSQCRIFVSTCVVRDIDISF